MILHAGLKTSALVRALGAALQPSFADLHRTGKNDEDAQHTDPRLDQGLHGIKRAGAEATWHGGLATDLQTTCKAFMNDKLMPLIQQSG